MLTAAGAAAVDAAGVAVVTGHRPAAAAVALLASGARAARAAVIATAAVRQDPDAAANSGADGLSTRIGCIECAGHRQRLVDLTDTGQAAPATDAGRQGTRAVRCAYAFAAIGKHIWRAAAAACRATVSGCARVGVVTRA